MSDSTTSATPAVDYATGGWTIGGGSGSMHAALSDASNTTYIEASASAGGVARVGIGDLALGTHDLLRYLQPTVKASSPGGTRTVAVRLYGPLAGQQLPEQTILLDGTIRVYNLAAFRAWPNGRAFTLADQAALRMSFRETDGVVGSLRVYEAGVTAAYNGAPTAVLDAVASPVTADGYQQGTWAYADPENDVQERYQERVYAYDSRLGWPTGVGTDAEIAWLDASGYIPIREVEVLSDATATDPLLFPPTGNFRRYIRVSDRGSGGRFGAWARQEWDMLVATPPAAPTLYATPDVAHARVDLAVLPAPGSPVDYFEVERSDDGGTTWVGVRDATPTLPYIPASTNRINNAAFLRDADANGVADGFTLYDSVGEGVVAGVLAAGVQHVSWTTQTGTKGLRARPHVNHDGSNIWPADSVWLFGFDYASDATTLPDIGFDAVGLSITWVSHPTPTTTAQRYVVRITAGVADVVSDLILKVGAGANHYFNTGRWMLEHAAGSAGGGGYGATPYADIEYAGSPAGDPAAAAPSAFVTRETTLMSLADRFAPRETPVRYRAREVWEDGSGAAFGTIRRASAWTEVLAGGGGGTLTATVIGGAVTTAVVVTAGAAGAPVVTPGATPYVTLTRDGRSWLHSPTEAALDYGFCHAGLTFVGVSREDQAAFWPEGRAAPVVNGGTIHTEEFDAIVLVFRTEAERVAFTALRALREPLLFQTLWGEGPLEQHWLRIGPQVEDERQGGYDALMTGQQIHLATFSAFVVDEPA